LQPEIPPGSHLTDRAPTQPITQLIPAGEHRGRRDGVGRFRFHHTDLPRARPLATQRRADFERLPGHRSRRRLED
jgi:hypothetical protein